MFPTSCDAVRPALSNPSATSTPHPTSFAIVAGSTMMGVEPFRFARTVAARTAAAPPMMTSAAYLRAPLGSMFCRITKENKRIDEQTKE
jgi:hypothetical protein